MGGTATPIAQRLADTVEESTLHMVNADPKRTPTFTMFGNPDFFFQIGNVCKGPSPDPGVPECVNPGFAWNHGDSQDEIGNTWFGMVGPGVASNGVDDKTWSDHVDLRPTINALLGLDDDYVDDGRVVTQVLDHNGDPEGARQAGTPPRSSAASYKQINAPFGQFAMDTLVASTSALKSSDALHYDSVESAIANLTSKRDVLAGDDPAGAERRGVREREARRESGQGVDQAGAGPARPGSCARGGEPCLTARSRSTSKGSSSRHRPGSSPSSVSGP